MDFFEHGGDIYRHSVTLDFSVNLNPLGMPPAVKETIAAQVERYAHYPDPACGELCRLLSEKEGVDVAHILCGNGAADLIVRLCLSQKPNKALLLAPTFSEYEKAVRLCGGEVVYHRLLPEQNFALTEKLLPCITPEISLLALCTPNNPTGVVTHLPLIKQIAERCQETGTLLLLDECFLEFTDAPSAINLLANNDRVVLLKAFTKSYAMAGLRLGYLICSNKALLAQVAFFGQSWSVSAVAQAAGEAALRVEGWMEESRRVISTERAFLAKALTELGFFVFPSSANFLLIRGAAGLDKQLLTHGILIRNCENFVGLSKGYYRIGVKRREENLRLLDAICKIQKKEGLSWQRQL